MKLIYVVLPILLMIITVAQAEGGDYNQEISSKSAALSHISSELHQFKNLLAKDTQKKLSVEQQLQQTEIAMGQLSQHIATTSEQLNIQNEQLAATKIQLAQTQATLARQQQQLAQQLHDTYVLGEQSTLKMFLNQENIKDFDRLTSYYHFLNQKRLTLVNDLNQTQQTLDAQQQEMAEHQKTLQQLQAQQLMSQTALQQTQQQRQQLLMQLNKKIKTRQNTVAMLQADKDALERVIRELKLQRTQSFVPTKFADLKGELPWPTQGPIRKHFGDELDNSSVKTSGIIINAPEGQKVYAIAPGKIVFANWLRGFGLLLIVDHGDGYLTLYGHNQNLFKQVGDSVNTGDLIATVGRSGGQNESGLYFAIRRSGHPLDPANWCISA